MLVWPSLVPQDTWAWLGPIQIGIALGFLGAFALVFLIFTRVFPSLAVPQRSSGRTRTPARRLLRCRRVDAEAPALPSAFSLRGRRRDRARRRAAAPPALGRASAARSSRRTRDITHLAASGRAGSGSARAARSSCSARARLRRDPARPEHLARALLARIARAARRRARSSRAWRSSTRPRGAPPARRVTCGARAACVAASTRLAARAPRRPRGGRTSARSSCAPATRGASSPANFLHATPGHLLAEPARARGARRRSSSARSARARTACVLALAGIGAMAGVRCCAGYQRASAPRASCPGSRARCSGSSCAAPESLPAWLARAARALFVALLAFERAAPRSLPFIAHAAHAGGFVARRHRGASALASADAAHAAPGRRSAARARGAALAIVRARGGRAGLRARSRPMPRRSRARGEVLLATAGRPARAPQQRRRGASRSPREPQPERARRRAAHGGARGRRRPSAPSRTSSTRSPRSTSSSGTASERSRSIDEAIAARSGRGLLPRAAPPLPRRARPRTTAPSTARGTSRPVAAPGGAAARARRRRSGDRRPSGCDLVAVVRATATRPVEAASSTRARDLEVEHRRRRSRTSTSAPTPARARERADVLEARCGARPRARARSAPRPELAPRLLERRP